MNVRQAFARALGALVIASAATGYAEDRRDGPAGTSAPTTASSPERAVERIERSVSRLETPLDSRRGTSMMEGCEGMMSGGGMMGEGGMMGGGMMGGGMMGGGQPNEQWRSPGSAR